MNQNPKFLALIIVTTYIHTYLHHGLDPETAIDCIDTNDCFGGVFHDLVEEPEMVSQHHKEATWD